MMNGKGAQSAEEITFEVGVLGDVFELIHHQHNGQALILRGLEQVFEIEQVELTPARSIFRWRVSGFRHTSSGTFF